MDCPRFRCCDNPEVAGHKQTCRKVRHLLKPKPPLEKEEQRECIKLLRGHGFHVGSTSQYRRSGQMLGLADLVLQHIVLRKGGWWETKKYIAKGFDPRDRSTWVPEPLRPDQMEFRERALVCNQLHGWGGRKEVEQFLIDQGLAYRAGNGSIQPVNHFARFWAGQSA